MRAARRLSTVSGRIASTDEPCIVQMQRMLRTIKPAPASLAQGIVHWSPPERAIRAAADALASGAVHGYGPDGGLPELAVSLHLVERPQVFGSSELEHGPGEEVVLDREPDAESRPLLEAVIDEQPVRLEELGRCRLEVPELEERGLDEAAESRGGVVIVVRRGFEHARELGGVVCAPRSALRVLVDIRR